MEDGDESGVPVLTLLVVVVPSGGYGDSPIVTAVVAQEPPPSSPPAPLRTGTANAAKPPSRRRLKILLLQGANLSYLGRREPELYGTTSAAELDDMLKTDTRAHGYDLEIFYTHVEGEAIGRLCRAVDESSRYCESRCLGSRPCAFA
jgi:hypothetical protein